MNVMHRIWKIFAVLALVCLLLGVALTAAGFFAGSSPVTMINHGYLDEYFVRLHTNWNIFLRDIGSLFG